MKDIVNRALHIHHEETAHDVQFQEEWQYKPSGDEYTVILYGSSRFEQAHATIYFSDGSRFVMYLNARNKNAPLAHQEWNLPRGKAKQVRWTGGATIPPVARIA